MVTWAYFNSSSPFTTVTQTFKVMQYGRNLLHYAAQFGHLHIVIYKLGCNPSRSDDMKQSPLHCAAKKGHMDTVKFLAVEKHCDPMSADIYGNTALHIAAHWALKYS